MGDLDLGLQLNTTSNHSRALSPLELYPDASTASLFSPLSPSPTQTMQDDLLAEKSAAKQPTPQQLSPNSEQATDNLEDQLSPGRKSRSPDPSPVSKENAVNKQQNHQQHQPPPLQTQTIESPLQLGWQDPTVTSPTNFWSSAAAEDGFMQGIPTLNGTIHFQNFPGPAPGPSPLFGGSQLAPQITLPAGSAPGQQRRSPSQQAHGFPRQTQPNMFLQNKSGSFSVWNSPQPASMWSSTPAQSFNPWGTSGQQRRSMAATGTPGPIAPIKKQQQAPNVFAKTYRRSASLPAKGPFPQGTAPFDFTGGDDIFRTDMYGVQAWQQERQQSGLDNMRFMEHQLLDIIRNPVDPAEHYKVNNVAQMTEGWIPRGQGEWRARTYGRRRDNYDGHCSDQIVPSVNSPSRGSPHSSGGSDSGERFSRKVFVGGLPPDIDEEEITASFRRFGPLVVDWPHKAESKSYFPPKGYAFLLFQDERSVQALIDACIKEDDKLYYCVSSPTMKDKPVQIRPWNLADSDFVMDGSQPLDPRKTIFVGGVPRPLRAVELAMIMDRLYGGVCYAGIDTDPELKYPKGAGRVAFSNQQSYIAAISARFVQLQHGDIDKRVEVKPYVLDDQMCDECQGARCGGKFAPFFCANVTCLQYYCEHCWANIHSRAGREFHKPLVKEGADRPRAVPFRWC
ncbi:cytoplasmic polyadenylation element-binding protein 2-like isoform X4 [Branchiostoma lanceolatum]|uniref:cytoplasmic polyadenylation element-binding protein 2-like isoform X4 n=1 Tax=Branchiostoma lanceolatum TaxID=7740 RepID=UPI0034569B14